MRNNRIFLRQFLKIRKCVKKTVSANEFNLRTSVFIFETWRGILGLQNSAWHFEFLFRFQDMARKCSLLNVNYVIICLKIGLGRETLSCKTHKNCPLIFVESSPDLNGLSTVLQGDLLHWEGKYLSIFFAETGFWNDLMQARTLDLSFWSFLTFCTMVWTQWRGTFSENFIKNHRKIWSNVTPKLLSCIRVPWSLAHVFIMFMATKVCLRFF